MAYQTGTLTGSYTHFDGTPHEGTVEIRPDNIRGNTIRDAAGNKVLSGPFTGKSAIALVAGEFSVDLPASNDSTLDPAGTTYTVYVRLAASGAGQKAVKGVFITAGQTVDMADLVSVNPADASYQERVNEATTSASNAAGSATAAAGSATTASSAATAAAGSATAAGSSAAAAAGSATTAAATLAGKADVSTTAKDLPDTTVGGASGQLAASVTSNVAANGAYTSPALDGAVATPPKRWAIKANAAATATITYPNSAGVSETVTVLAGEVLTFRQKTTTGWGAESGNKPLAQLDARFANRRRPFLPNCHVPWGVAGAGASGYSARTNTFIAPYAASDITVRLANWYWQPSTVNPSGDNAGPQNLAEKFYLEIGGVSIPFTFRGALNASLDPFGYIESDPIALPIAAGDTYNLRSYLAAGTGNVVFGHCLQGSIAYANAGGSFTSGSDVSANTGAMATTGQATSPMPYLMGVWATPAPARSAPADHVGVGDSIMAGYGDIYSTGNQDLTGRTISGWFIRSMALTRVAVITAVSAQRASLVASSIKRHRSTTTWQGDVATVALGTNDVFFDAASAATVQGWLSTICTELLSRGAKDVFVSTLAPRTTSTDSWATTVNQTPGATESVRVALNALIRSKSITGQTGVIELADVVETSRDSGIWKAGGTGDGLHPNSSLTPSIATVAQAAYAAKGY